MGRPEGGAFSLPPHLTVAAFVPGGLLLYIWVLRVTWYAPKADAAARTLRELVRGRVGASA
ncbi:hypothetical protein GCM10010425_14820 [Streptomyces spororaveus]|uniref:Uncharacterized protein n=1 Tax=Streptomyces spororaveus TaxID=284039 RepID=A0ABQ3T5G2_9ACTN|nr:hypothetical protein [Streptomyces spororaveus]GHI75633.1 hypothetical protein Sspor_11940 [Streptomyces spororaveus]